MSGENRMLTTEHEYAGAKLVQVSLSEDAAEQRRGSSVRYNFRTTYAFTRGHFVIGTTPAPFESYQVFGDGLAIGNTLMANPPPELNINTVLLPESTGCR